MLDHGNIEIALGEQYIKQDEWGRAAIYFEKGIKKGKLSNPAKAYQLLGNTYFKMGNVARAEENYQKAINARQ